MNMLLCLWTVPASSNSDFTLELLLLRLSFLSFSLIVCYVVGTLLHRSAKLNDQLGKNPGTAITSDFGNTMKKLYRDYVKEPLSRIFRKTSDGVANYWPVWFVVCCCSLLVLAAARIPKYEVVELHDVRVEKKVAENKWLMDDPVTGEFLYTGCSDFPNDKVIWAGYIARQVRYEEHGNCKSIERADLGFIWLRDKDGNAREIR